MSYPTFSFLFFCTSFTRYFLFFIFIRKGAEPLANEIMDEILKYAVDNGILNLSDTRSRMVIDKKRKLLEKHPYQIWQGKDEKWYTYLPDDEKKRRLLKKTSKEMLENEIVEFWNEKLENPTIRAIFTEWNDRRLELKKISDATHIRNIQIFDRHYKEFGNRKIKSVEKEEFCDFLERQIPEHDLTSKAFSNLKTVTKGLLKWAKKRKLITYNVEELLWDIDVSEKDFRKVVKEDYQEVFDERDLPLMMEYLSNNPDLRNMGILMMFVTGIRVGELVTLKRSDFEGQALKIRRTETRILIKKGTYEYRVKEFPKTEAGVRTAVVPMGFSWLVESLLSRGTGNEFIFYENGSRLTTAFIRRRMFQVCKKIGIFPKSPHKARKTYGSILLDNGVDNRMITDLMGHSDVLCTEAFYHRNRKGLERKIQIVSNLPEFYVR